MPAMAEPRRIRDYNAAPKAAVRSCVTSEEPQPTELADLAARVTIYQSEASHPDSARNKKESDAVNQGLG